MTDPEKLVEVTDDPLARALLGSAELDRAPSDISLKVLTGLGVGASALTAAGVAQAAVGGSVIGSTATGTQTIGWVSVTKLMLASAVISGGVMLGGEQLIMKVSTPSAPVVSRGGSGSRSVDSPSRPDAWLGVGASQSREPASKAAAPGEPSPSPASQSVIPELPDRGQAVGRLRGPSTETTEGTAPVLDDPPSIPPPPEVPEAERAQRRHDQAAKASLEREVALLDQARTVLGQGQPTKAWQILEAYRSESPQPALWLESVVLRVESLLALGQRAAAEREASRVLESAPSSRHAARLRQLLSNSHAP